MNNKEIVSLVIDELEKRSIIKKNCSTYKNTERILYDYPKLKESIKDRKEQIKEYKNFGLPSKSKSITSFSLSSSKDRKDVEDILEQTIRSLTKDIYKTEVVIKFIDRVLDRFKNDPYISIISLYYFEGKTHEQIAEIFDKKKNNSKSIASTTIANNKYRLIKELQKYIFPNDYLYQLLGY